MNIEEAKKDIKKQYQNILTKMEEEINDLENKINDATESGKVKLNKSLEELKVEHNELKTKMKEIEYITESTWKEWKQKGDVVLKKMEDKASELKQSIKQTVAAW